MSEVLAQLEKKGGGMSEKVLWTNPNPTASFARQTITLNQSIDDFKEIALHYRLSNVSSSTKDSFVIYEVEELKKYKINATNASGAIGVRTTNETWVRSLFCDDLTHITFGTAFMLGQTASDNAYVIPIKVVGLK